MNKTLTINALTDMSTTATTSNTNMGQIMNNCVIAEYGQALVSFLNEQDKLNTYMTKVREIDSFVIYTFELRGLLSKEEARSLTLEMNAERERNSHQLEVQEQLMIEKSHKLIEAAESMKKLGHPVEDALVGTAYMYTQFLSQMIIKHTTHPAILSNSPESPEKNDVISAYGQALVGFIKDHEKLNHYKNRVQVIENLDLFTETLRGMLEQKAARSLTKEIDTERKNTKRMLEEQERIIKEKAQKLIEASQAMQKIGLQVNKESVAIAHCFLKS